MITKVYWFSHGHESRNDLLRFGLMRLHKQGKIKYIERKFSDAASFGFSKRVCEYHYLRHKSFYFVERGEKKIYCLIDNEDSFALFSDLIKEVDIYFCAGYNTELFEGKSFITPYNWQDTIDLKWYKKTITKNGRFIW